MKKIAFFLFIFLCFVCFLFAACKKLAPNGGSAPLYVILNEDNFENSNRFYGTMKATYSTNLSFQTEGKISYLPYSRGDFVKKGTVLARIDAVLYNIRLKEEKENLKNAQIQVSRNDSYYKRMDILHKKGAISDNDWEDAYFNLKTSKEQIEIQREKVNYLEKQVDFTAILAPYDGYITDKFVGLSQNIIVSQPIYGFIGAYNFYVETNVNFDVAKKLKVKDKVLISFENKKYSGEITHIAYSSLNSAGYIVKIAILDKTFFTKEGANVEVFFNLDNFLTVPLKVIFEENNKNYIYKLSETDFDYAVLQKIEVKIEKIFDECAQITLIDKKPLNKDDKLIINDNKKYFDGQRVKL